MPNLTITGPGAARLTIDGNHVDRVFLHTPSVTGTLTLSNVTVADGRTTADKAYGGCIYSKGNVVLRNAVVTSCSAIGQSVAFGGGVVTFGNFTAYSSVLSSNIANAQVGASGVTSAAAGGALAFGNMGLYGSVISGNTAESAHRHGVRGRCRCYAADDGQVFDHHRQSRVVRWHRSQHQ